MATNGTQVVHSTVANGGSRADASEGTSIVTKIPSGVFGKASVPVQQTFNGPATTFINVFERPGEYTIGFNFQPQGQSQSSQPQPGYFGPQIQPPYFAGPHQTSGAPRSPYNSFQ